LIRPEGLPNRPWYKHQIYAPGFYTGYGVKTLPGIREAVDAKQWGLAEQQAKKVTESISTLNSLVSKAADECRGL
jgi:N-acetylated-alpha-linked acidic dipeptidase